MPKFFTRKGYGRIFVECAEDIEHVEQAIRDLDAFEAEYLPDRLITTFDHYPRTVFVGKFSDLDLDTLEVLCFARGVPILIWNAGDDEYPDHLLKSPSGDWIANVARVVERKVSYQPGDEGAFVKGAIQTLHELGWKYDAKSSTWQRHVLNPPTKPRKSPEPRKS